MLDQEHKLLEAVQQEAIGNNRKIIRNMASSCS